MHECFNHSRMRMRMRMVCMAHTMDEVIGMERYGGKGDKLNASKKRFFHINAIVQ